MIVSPLELQGTQSAFEGLPVTAMVLGTAAAGAGQFRSHMIAGIGIEPLLQRARCQAQSLPSRCHLYRFEIQVGDGLAT